MSVSVTCRNYRPTILCKRRSTLFNGVVEYINGVLGYIKWGSRVYIIMVGYRGRVSWMDIMVGYHGRLSWTVIMVGYHGRL